MGDPLFYPVDSETKLPPASVVTALSKVIGQPGPKGDPGAQGLPGVNAVDNDSAVAGYVGTAGTSATKAALQNGFASQMTVTSSTLVADVNTWLAASSPIGVKRLVGSVSITNAPLVVPSGTYLDATGATITSTFVGNMLQNVNAKSTTNRDAKITIIGGTWIRNAGGPAGAGVDGDASGAHSIFLRHVDGLLIRELKVSSTGGKYMIAVGDVTNFHIADITGGNLSSDTVHITGPARFGLVENVNVVTGGDDVVATTTTDYPGYSDVHGDITDLTIRNIKGGNTTRTVLIAGAAYANGTPDGHVLDRIVVDTVTQTGSGASVWTGASGNTDTLGSITMTHIYGGVIQLRHPNHGVVIIEDAPRGINAATQDTNTVVNIGRLLLRDTTVASGNVMLLNNAGITIDYFEIANVTSAFDSLINLILGTIKKLVIRNPRYTGTNNLLAVSGTLNALQIDSGSIDMKAGNHVVRMNATGFLGSATFNDCEVTAADTSSGILVNVASTAATAGAVIVNRGTYTGIGRFLEKANGTAGTTMVRLTDVAGSGLNRYCQVGGGVLDFAYSNLRITGVVNQPVRLYNSATGKVSGTGWSGYASGSLTTDAAAAVQCTASDFPADLSLLSKANGDRATNTNNALACGVGPAVSNGTNWKNLYTGATY